MNGQEDNVAVLEQFVGKIRDVHNSYAALIEKLPKCRPTRLRPGSTRSPAALASRFRMHLPTLNQSRNFCTPRRWNETSGRLRRDGVPLVIDPHLSRRGVPNKMVARHRWRGLVVLAGSLIPRACAGRYLLAQINPAVQHLSQRRQHLGC
jgi:hypothetical protein